MTTGARFHVLPLKPDVLPWFHRFAKYCGIVLANNVLLHHDSIGAGRHGRAGKDARALAYADSGDLFCPGGNVL
jgi:hypothetical protein